jgi:hypothetical protein
MAPGQGHVCQHGREATCQPGLSARSDASSYWECRTSASISWASQLRACCRPRSASLPRGGRRWRRRLRHAGSYRWAEHRGSAAVRFNPDQSAIGADGDGAVFIGAKDMNAKGPIALDDRRVGMAKTTVPLHGNHPHAWVHGAHKGLGAGCAAATMGGFYYSTMTHISSICPCS